MRVLSLFAFRWLSCGAHFGAFVVVLRFVAARVSVGWGLRYWGESLRLDIGSGL